MRPNLRGEEMNLLKRIINGVTDESIWKRIIWMYVSIFVLLVPMTVLSYFLLQFYCKYIIIWRMGFALPLYGLLQVWLAWKGGWIKSIGLVQLNNPVEVYLRDRPIAQGRLAGVFSSSRQHVDSPQMT
jgi:hypothetical protein